MLAILGLVAALAGTPRAVFAEPIEAELWARIVGQTSDLEWMCVRAARAPGQDVWAWAATVEGDAALVIERVGGAWEVSLLGRARERRWVRRVEFAEGQASSAREAVAVIVRGLLVTLALGEPVTLDAPAPAPVAWAPYVSIGADGVWAGDALAAVRAGAGLHREGVALGVGLSAGPARSLDDGRTVVSLARHTAVVTAGLELVRAGGWALGARAGVGVALFQRAATSRDPTLTATAPRLSASALGVAEAAVSWRPSRLGVELAVGVDVVPGAPELAYRVGDVVEVRTDAGVVEPRVSLSLVLLGAP